MAETPVGYFPDVPVAWNVSVAQNHLTEIQTARSGREQRRAVVQATGIRRFAASSASLQQADRSFVASFLQTQRGRLGAFYFWNPAPMNYTDVSVGTATAQTRLIIPYRLLNSTGGSAGTISDVRVAGVSTAFTTRHLIPRTGTYATIRFDDVNQTIACGTAGNLKPTGDMTFAAWVFVVAIPGGGSAMIMENETANASGTSFGLTAGSVFLRTNQAGANTIPFIATSIPLGTWTHWAASRSGTNVTFYKNGVSLGTVGGSTNPVVATRSFHISSDIGNVAINGMASDCQFYDSALAAPNIALIYAGTPSPNGNWRGWWKLTEGTGTTATDSSGYANTGTLTNSPVWVAGEEEIQFGGSTTGAITATGTMRERVITRADSDSIAQRFLQAAEVRAIFDFAVKEVI